MAGAEILIFYTVSRLDLESPLFRIQFGTRGRTARARTWRGHST